MRSTAIAISIAGGTAIGAAVGALASVVTLATVGGLMPAALAAGTAAGGLLGGALAGGWSGRRHALLDAVERTTGRTSAWWGVDPLPAAISALLEHVAAGDRARYEHARRHEIDDQVVRSSLERLRAAIHELPEGLVVLDACDEVVIGSACGRRRLGLADDADPGPLPAGGDRDVVLRAVAEAREDRATGERRLELPPGGLDGVEREVTVRALRDGAERDVGSVLLVRDLSRERELGRMTSEFVAKASHELRTPLSSIAAYAEMLVDGEARDEAARTECYEVIEAEARRLGRLIDDMLDISRIEAGLARVDRREVDLGELLERGIETIQPQAGEKRQRLEMRRAEVDLHVEGDSDMLLRVMLNLLSNAVKYTPEGGRIIASVDSDHLTGSIVLTVEDTGMGIPADRLEKVFEKFYRIESYERMARGTGLGLNLCRHIVESLHGGQIGVESEVGRGSRFWISVPVRHAGGRCAA